MADIELVIKVDERDVDFVRKNYKPTGYSYIPLHIQTAFVSAILNGTPLPNVLDKLRDEIIEIDKHTLSTNKEYENGFMACKNRILRIFDKCKTKDKELTANNDLESEEEYEQE